MLLILAARLTDITSEFMKIDIFISMTNESYKFSYGLCVQSQWITNFYGMERNCLNKIDPFDLSLYFVFPFGQSNSKI